jgi:hypothetical protein
MLQITLENILFPPLSWQALVAAQRAELQVQATELAWHRNQTRALAATQRDLHTLVVANATARFEAILREQVKLELLPRTTPLQLLPTKACLL